jgi:hypothetical protein
VFRRRKNDDVDAPDLDDDVDLASGDEDELDDEPAAAEGDVDDAAGPGLSRRPDGPWDSSEISVDDDVVRLDLGSLLVPGIDGMELRVDIDQESGALVGVTAVIGESAVQLQPFAAPRSEGIWDDVRTELRRQINAGRGLLEELPGRYGTELRTSVPAALPDGTEGVQPARFVGIDGPRWLLRAVFLGEAAMDPAKADALDEVLRAVVVVRGNEAMAPGDPLPLRLPEQATEVDDAPEGDAPWTDGDIDPFERGPEITEIH